MNEDVIKIDPNGTEGEIIDVGGLQIMLPKKPPKKEILFSEKTKDLQMW